MNYFSVGLLVLTALFVGFGALWGLIRGRNRAILRLVIIVLCLVVALVARGPVVDIVLNMDMGDGVIIKDYILSTINSGETTLPDTAVNLIFALVEIIAGLVVFLLSFISLGIVSIVLFWILKLFVKKGEKKRAGAGALVGAIQGALVAFVICAPVTGLLVQANKLASLDIEIGEGQTIADVLAPLGLEEATQSGIGKFYDTTGGWFFDVLSTTQDENGNKVSLDATVDVATTVIEVADTFTGLTESMEALTKEDATAEERIDAMNNMGQALKDVGASMDTLGDDAKQMLNDIASAVSDMLGGEEMPEALTNILKDFDVEKLNFSALGDTMQGLASYLESVENDDLSSFTQQDANQLVNGLANNTFIFDLIESATSGEGESETQMPTLIDVGEDQKQLFINAINATEIEQKYKDNLMSIFGLNQSAE